MTGIDTEVTPELDLATMMAQIIEPFAPEILGMLKQLAVAKRELEAHLHEVNSGQVYKAFTVKFKKPATGIPVIPLFREMQLRRDLPERLGITHHYIGVTCENEPLRSIEEIYRIEFILSDEHHAAQKTVPIALNRCTADRLHEIVSEVTALNPNIISVTQEECKKTYKKPELTQATTVG